MNKKKLEYIAPSCEVICLPKGLSLLTTLSLDGGVSDYEGDEQEDFVNEVYF